MALPFPGDNDKGMALGGAEQGGRLSYQRFFCEGHYPGEGGEEVGFNEVMAYEWHCLRMARVFEQDLGAVTQQSCVTL